MSRIPRALVIGGSLGGLFAANLLMRTGWDVEVFEQSPDPLSGRGAGIIPHPQLFDALTRIGIAIDDSFGVRIPERVVFGRNGETLGTLAMPQFLTTWGRLHELLMAAFPATRYHYGAALKRVAQDGNGVTATFANSSSAHGDMLIAADGIRSTVRAQLLPEAVPRYAGYVGWRGLADENLLSPDTHRDLFPRFAFSLAPREQMLGYPVAGFTNSTRAGERCYNFVWYRATSADTELPQLCTDTSGKCHGMSIPPPLIRTEVLDEMRAIAHERLSPQFAEVVRHARQPFFQPIFDVESSQIVFGRIALLGDAAFVARPHCGMGVTKAAGDAMVLAHALRNANNAVESGLAEYGRQRAQFGAAVVKRARVLGAHLEGAGNNDAERTQAASHHTPDAVMREIAVVEQYL